MTSPIRFRLAFALVPAVLLAFASGGSSATDADGTDAGADAGLDAKPDQATTDAATDAGGDLYPAGTTKIVVTQKGGFTAPGPDGSVCQRADVTYTLLLPSRELSWKLCEPQDGGPLAFRTGQKTITPAELTTVEQAIRDLRRTTQTQCGADAPSEQIVFTTPSGDVTYHDDFYFCDPKDTKIYVSGLGAVFSALGDLAK